MSFQKTQPISTNFHQFLRVSTNFYKSLFVFIALFFSLFLGSFAVASNSPASCDSANDPLGVGCGSASGLNNVDPRYTVARLINQALGLLGVITLVLVLYAGFLWTTSAGNEEKTSQAKAILYGAVIGLAVIMSAYTISYFIIRQLYTATSNSATYTP